MHNVYGEKSVASKKKVDIRRVSTEIEKIMSRADRFVGIMEYIQREFGYDTPKMNEIEGRVREIVFQRGNPPSEMKKYVQELFEADKRFKVVGKD